MSRGLVLKIVQRSFSLNSPSTSSSNASFIDYSLSQGIFKDFLPKIDYHSHGFIEKLNEDLRSVHLIEKKIASVRNDLRKCFDPEIRLVPIGSAANLLLNNSSDLDLFEVLLPFKNSRQWKDFMKKFSENEQFRMSYMNKINLQLKAKKIGFSHDPYYKARIPLIRFFSKRWLQVDIQFGNIAPIRSSLFVRTCVEYDERVGLLIHWLTNKFQEAGILSSKNLKFSRYHVNILVIHFLQAIPYPVLPQIIQLSPWLSTKNDWNNAVKVLTRQGSVYVPNCSEVPNEQSVGALAVQLIDYFSQIDFHTNAIDTRGNVVDKLENDPLHFKIVDEFFAEPTCRVSEAPRLLTDLFKKLKEMVVQEKYEELFKYHQLEKKIKNKEE
ncbi:Poly(A) RNA polymerase mitochondrial-like central palm domain-containing protein [Caenorhabditis elegans]|uniref:Poly(A) RNA polymerase mitochondrial-like central palm domain-containing protein n=1 Tax=Caenorhabditis elegans TaxID=6239 RepID=L8E6M1_CAEEL|nr:Polynucleotide adenylyltransferase [Caenorhabditis elegans]CCQ25694.1 Polynucleotide adenylyltransferase [Caenorhabditis elegans]|eukprot:NP_001263887.1 Uncharacterized protein CELE_C53A5.16 [Caenorhabditis elegans]